MYRLMVIAFLFTSYKADAAPDTLNFKSADEATYKYYMQQKWDSVINIGSLAIEQGIDYYYLRMRIGIAYYSKKQYRLAEPHFLKALYYNSSNDVAKSYLFYCYVYSDQYDQAGKLSCTFSDSLSNALGTKQHKLIDVIDADLGEKLSSDTKLYDNAYFAQLETANHIGKQLSFFESYTYYNQTAYWGHVDQSDIYIKGNIPLPKQWLLTPAVNLVFVDAQPYNYNSIQFVSLIACQRSFDIADIGVSLSYSDIEFKTQTQEAFLLTCYPLGNNKLVAKATVSLQEDSFKTLRSGVSGSIDYKPFLRLTLTGTYYNSNARYINESDAYLVNNAFTLTTSRFTFCASVAISKHVNIYALYQYENAKDIFKNIPFHYNTAMAGLKFYL